MKRRAILAGAVLALVASLAGGAWANRERLMLAFLGAKTEKRTLAEQEALILPHIRVFQPTAGSPPFPAIVQFHGCAGYRPDFMAQWAKVGTEAGFLVIAVDSMSPRGIDREEALSSVCAGKRLIGQERAGDVAAALAAVAARKDVDPARIVAAGWSHGAWSLMDYLALSAASQTPPSLKGEAPAIDPAGVIAFYPYCGEGTWSRLLNWNTKAKVLALIAGADTIVDGAECRARFEAIRQAGTPVDLVWYENADHVFDDAGLVGGEFAHYYGAAAAEDAARRYRSFLEAIRSRP
ncbi:MAG: dienelactone hydrolase family protein [Parvularculaceae bacterium]|nr:dienelactone hydrolase family protein [Parvularculaceae bacterium]